MPSKQQHHLGLPTTTARAGDTTPDPGLSYCEAYSTTENANVVWDGARWQVPGKATVGPVTKLYAIRFPSSAYRFTTQATGGELGINTGFGNISLIYLRRYPTATGVLRSKIAGSGWKHVLSPSGFYCNYHNATTFIGSAYMPVAGWMVGRVIVVVSRITATPGVMEMAVDTLWSSTTPAMANYLGLAVADCLGSESTFAYPSLDADILAGVDFRGLPSRAQLDAYVQAARVLGDLPSTLVGATVTHRKSLKQALAGQNVVAGQTAPSTLPDTITGAAADISTRVSSPTITIVEQAIDGRQVSGVAAWSALNYYESAGGGVRGTALTGLTIDVWVKCGFISGNDEIVIGDHNADHTQGYSIRSSGGNWRGTIAWLPQSSIYTLGAIVVGKPTRITLVFDRGYWRWYIDGVLALQIQGGSTDNQFNTSSTGLRIGRGQSLGLPAPSHTVYAVAGCDQPLVAAEITAMQVDLETNGRLRLPAGKINPHQWEFNVDMAAAPDAVPERIIDRAGNDPLVRRGFGVSSVGRGKGIGGFSATNYYVTQTAAAALPGATTGHWGECLIYHRPVAADTTLLYQFGASNGWYVNLHPQGVYVVQMNAGGGAGTTTIPLSINAWHHILWYYANPGLYIYVDGIYGNSQNYTSYIVSTAVLTIYANNGHDSVLAGLSGGNFIPTAAEITAASNAALSNLSVAGIPGKTSRRWNFDLDIAEAGGAVPATITERISGGHANRLYIGGSSLLANRRTERVWGLETSPINVGAQSTATTAYYESATAFSDHSHLPSWYTIVFTVLDQMNTASPHLLMNASYSGHGPQFVAASNNATVYFGMATSAAFYSVSAVAIPATEVGKVQVLSGTFTGTEIRQFLRRVAAGTQTTTGTCSPGTAVLRLLCDQLPRPAYGISIHGFASGPGVMTLEEHQAHYDAILAADGDIQALPGKTAHLYSFLRDSSGGALPATLVDKVGTFNLMRSGAPVYNPIYARSFAG